MRRVWGMAQKWKVVVGCCVEAVYAVYISTQCSVTAT